MNIINQEKGKHSGLLALFGTFCVVTSIGGLGIFTDIITQPYPFTERMVDIQGIMITVMFSCIIMSILFGITACLLAEKGRANDAKRRKIACAAIVISVIIPVLFILIDGYKNKPRSMISNKNVCANWLRLIDAAKEGVAMEKGWAVGTDCDNPTNKTIINQFLYSAPTCPSKGTYTYGKLGEKPKCSAKGHNEIY